MATFFERNYVKVLLIIEVFENAAVRRWFMSGNQFVGTLRRNDDIGFTLGRFQPIDEIMIRRVQYCNCARKEVGKGAKSWSRYEPLKIVQTFIF